jgi:hypothetical protein
MIATCEMCQKQSEHGALRWLPLTLLVRDLRHTKEMPAELYCLKILKKMHIL